MINVLIVGVILIFFAGWVIATILDAKREKEEIDKIIKPELMSIKGPPEFPGLIGVSV